MIVYFEQFFLKNCRDSPKFWATSFHDQVYALILTKNRLGYILGDFFQKTRLVTLAMNQAKEHSPPYPSSRSPKKL
jgi:hypothetical protein